MDDLEQRVVGLLLRHAGTPATCIPLARAIIPMVLEEAAKVAEKAHERWADQDPCPVVCDVTACEEIAAAIRAIGAP